MEKIKFRKNHRARMVMLLVLMLVGVSSAWAQTEICSYSFGSSTPEAVIDDNNLGGDKYILSDNGTIKFYAQGLKTGDGNRTFVYQTYNGIAHIKLQNESKDLCHFKIQFPKGTVRPGDILSVSSARAYSGPDSDYLGYKVNNDGEGITEQTDSKKTYSDGPVTLNHTIKSDEIIEASATEDYILIYRLNSGVGYGSFSINRPAGYTVTFEGLYGGGTVTARRLDIDSEISSGWTIPNGTNVKFTPVPNGENLAWKWNIDGTEKYSQDPQTVTINKDITVTHQFGSVYVNVYTNNLDLGTVNISHNGVNKTTFHETPFSGEYTITATPVGHGIFDAWYSTEDCKPEEKLEGKGQSFTVNNPSGTNNYYAKFIEGKIVNINVEPAGLTPDIKIYFHSYHDGCIHGSNGNWGTIANHKAIGNGTNIDVTAGDAGGYVFDGWYINGVKQEGAPQADYNYGNVNNDVTIVAKYTPVTHPANLTCQNGNIDLSKVAAYGHASFDGSKFIVNDNDQYGNGLKISFTSPQDFSNVKTITINGAEFHNIPFTKATSGDLYPNKTLGGGKTVINLNNKNNQDYKQISTITLREINAGAYTISSIVVEFDHIPAEPLLVNGTTATMVIPVGKTLTLSANSADDTYWREYDAKDGNMINTRIGNSEYNTPVRAISGLSQGTYYFAAERRRTCEFGQTHYASEKTWVTVDVEPQGTMPTELDRIKQPTYGTNHNAVAKEYIAFADLTASDGKPVKGWKDGEGNHITSVTGTAYHNTTDGNEPTTLETDKQKIAYVLGNHAYPVSQTDGLCISKWGRAGLVEGQTEIPTRATLIFKAAGTDDFFVLLKNYLPTISGQPYGHDRRHIKVWYTNDQNVDASGNRKLMPFLCSDGDTNNDFYFYGERGEDRSNGLGPLQISVRLQHLGKDGTCNIFVTYEDDAADEMVWVKGIVVKRPDLKVTIGRTDRYGYDAEGNLKAGMHENVKVTPFGFDKPYQWDFSTSGFYAKKEPNGSDDASNETKKVNEYDGRTYICGIANGQKVMDHLLVFSDGQAGGDKAQFDGRKKTNGKHAGYEDDESDNNEHIELLHPTKYGTEVMNTDNFNNNRRAFVPFLSDGIKVNVTGSGWFTIACSAPEAPVKMKVLSSTNGGNAYMNILREFDIPQTTGAKPETNWQTYRVYLKAHVEKDGSDGFWAGDIKTADDAYGNDITITDPEQTQMSLYIVFDSEYPNAQLNIHYLQWANELPADYVFQREEDPKLLNTLQSIVSNGTADKPGLYWQAGNDKMWEDKNASIPMQNTNLKNYPSSFNSGTQIQDADIPGQDSGNGSVSRNLGGEWNVAAGANSVAHTEIAYKNGAKDYNSDGTNVYSLNQANGTTSDQNLEFAIPISGSFFRFMPMKNQFISTWIVPEAGKSTSIYILDETGKPIPFCEGADTNGDSNKGKITQEAREHGWIHAATYPGDKSTTNPIVADGTKALRIDFAALAGKEYFIVTNGGKISLARLQATDNDWRANVEVLEGGLTLNDNANNSSTISSAMTHTDLGDGKYARYLKSATLNRTFTKDTWASLVLPFSLNEKKLEEVFGPGTKCMHFTKVDKANNTIYLTQHFYNMVVAGRPVFIRPTQEVTNPVFTDVTLQTGTVKNTEVRNDKNELEFTFVASYDNQTIYNYDLYLNTNNSFNYLKVDAGSMQYPGMRSFIQNNCNWDFSEGKDLQTNTGGAKARFLNFFDEDEGFSTGIEEFITQEFGEDVTVITKSTKVYDLKGRIVANGSNIDNLPAGIYLVNGKKYLVK